MLSDLLIPLIAVGLAELGDKTQLSLVLLSSKTKKHSQLLLGAILAFLVVDGFAILVGSWVTNVVPMSLLKVVSGVVFVVFGVLILRGGADMDEGKLYSNSPFVSGFALIFITEWGDKTQIAAALFATRYNAWMVLIGAVTALAILSAMAVYLGKFVSDRVDKRIISKIAGAVFVLMGLSFFLI